jgi:adenylosuccinate lyase
MAHSLLERTLDDSANRRFLLPEAFLIGEELLRRAHHILFGLIIHDGASARNLATYGAFSATERLLMELVKAGADRQVMHEVIRRHSLAAWEALRQEAPKAGSAPSRTGAASAPPTYQNPVIELLATDPTILAFLPAEQVRALLDASEYVGDAAQRAQEMAGIIRTALGSAAVC